MSMDEMKVDYWDHKLKALERIADALEDLVRIKKAKEIGETLKSEDQQFTKEKVYITEEVEEESVDDMGFPIETQKPDQAPTEPTLKSVYFVRQTELAVLVKSDGMEAWIPKKALKSDFSNNTEKAQAIVIHDWWEKKLEWKTPW